MPTKPGFPQRRPYSATVKLSEQQRYLWRRKLAARKESAQHVLSNMVNAYLLGEWEPPERPRLTRSQQQQAYRLWGEDGYDPDDGLPPNLDHGDDEATDLEDLQERPPRWGVRELQAYLNEVFDRDFRLSTIYVLLQEHFPRKKGQWAYAWSGEDDPEIPQIVEKIEEGEMDRIRDERLAKIGETKQAKKQTKKQVKKKEG